MGNEDPEHARSRRSLEISNLKSDFENQRRCVSAVIRFIYMRMYLVQKRIEYIVYQDEICAVVYRYIKFLFIKYYFVTMITIII